MSAQHFRSLDLLRGLAAVAVALGHFFLYFGILADAAEVAAVVAVEVFFVLSGFVLAPQLHRCLASGEWHDAGTFVARRWMRTVPAYFAALVLITIMLGYVGSPEFLRYLLYVQNFSGQMVGDDYYPVAWSLSVEEWFYVVFVLVILAAGALPLGARRLWVVAAVFVLAIILLRCLVAPSHDWGGEVRRVVIYRLDAIGAGVLLYLLYQRVGARLAAVPVALMFAAWLAALLASALSLQVAHVHILWRESYFLAVALFGSVSILAMIRLERTLAAPPVQAGAKFLASISYSTYLFHIPLLLLVTRLCRDYPTWAQLLIYLGVTAGFAWIFYTQVERPILARRPAYKQPQAARPSSLG